MIREAGRGIVVIPIILKPVPIQHNLHAIIIEIRDIEVAVAVPHKCTECPQYHHLLNTLKVESYSAS